MGNHTSNRIPWGLALILLLAAGSRSLYLIFPSMDADQAINGLMARHILMGEFPIFFYGQDYCGSLENYLVAVVFLLCGSSRFTLDLAIGLISLVLVYFIFELASRVLDRRKALLAALLAAVPSGYFAFTSVLARSAYIETPLLGVLLFLVVGRILGGDRRPATYLLTGLLGGLGLWAHFLVVFYLVPAGLLLAIKERGFLRDPRVLAFLAAGVLLGGLPFWIYNTIHPLATWFFLQGNPGHEPFLESLKAFFGIRLPELLGVRDIAGKGFYIPLVSAILYGLILSGFLLLFLWRGTYFRRSLPGGRVFTPEADLTLALLLFYPLIFSLSGFAAHHTTRYLVPLYPAIPILLAFLFFQSPRGRRLPARIFLGLLLASNAYSIYRTAVVFQPRQVRDYQRRTQTEMAVISFLKERGIKKVYVPDYWVAVPLTFAAREEIIFAQPLLDRYPLFTRIVDRSPRPAFLLSGDAPDFEATLTGLGGTFQKERFGKWWLFFDIQAPPYRFSEIPTRRWRAYGETGGEMVAAVFDRNLDTRWSYGRDRIPGDAIVLDLGEKVPDLARVVLLAGTREGLPGGLRLEISADGLNWNTAANIPAYWNSLVWSGPHPFVQPEKGTAELIFSPQPGRFLKIIQTGGWAQKDWEIAEIVVYRASPGPADTARTGAPYLVDLLHILPTLGIDRVWAGPWIQAHLPPGYREEKEPGHRLGPLSWLTGGRSMGPLPPAFLVRKDQAEELREALDRLNPGMYRESVFREVTLFYAVAVRDHYRLLSRSNWRVAASINDQEAGKAVDGKRATRWTTRAPQVPETWFRLDLGRPETTNRLRLLLGNSRNDFPRRLEVRFSLSGSEWWAAAPLNPPVYWDGERWFRHQTNEPDLMFQPEPVRFIEFRQQGKERKHFWSIHEIEVFSPEDFSGK